ncbi:hypothetical protein N478_10650 [Pseudoalteromonas luteoviolacea S4060-1]|uniref:Uncharacterized protein n=2 Tax=Pseudoalteromonas luteoviolacea TaxID=43657 RepID=A0A167P690_9GAMM|nr:hypothetical protein N478_10650 [Pseudoalteromonas luteoviolacea S4060-1]
MPIIDIKVGVNSLMHSKPAIDVLCSNGPYKEDVMFGFAALMRSLESPYFI